MRVCYNKFWKLLIDKGMYCTDFIPTAGLTTNVIAYMGKNEGVRIKYLQSLKVLDNANFQDKRHL